MGILVESTEWLFLHCFQVELELEFRNVGFCGGRKTGVPGEKPSAPGQEPTTNSTHMTPRPGIEPGPHWWEVSALTTAPSLLTQSTTILT